ncbi:hypothetical protein IFT48_01030 [Pseudomonas fluorescens]|uniref:hypothetical protein n=1 Tax=Pseudomonas fluorescens TaxID=294 RepID=UPI001930BB92|nr:hypothetical protein [Pseudomonas fluorescens]MBD8088576.1 hypothetical protein [Pseudomonas fluorescens]
MNAIQAKAAQQRGIKICADINDMFYSRGYSPHEYDEASDQLVAVLDDLYHHHEFGHLSSLMMKVTNILTPPNNCSRRPGITSDDLIKHLVRFPVMPEVGAWYIFGDAELNTLVVNSTLKSAAFAGTQDSEWQTMLNNLAKDGDLENWKLLSEGLFYGSEWAGQRCEAITSVSSFDTGVIVEHKGILGEHIQSLLDNMVEPIRFGDGGRYEPTVDASARLYDTLMALGHLPLAHQFIEREYAECHSPTRIHDYQAKYDWTPADSTIKWLSRTRYNAGKDNLCTSVTLYLLTMPELPEDVQFNEFPLPKLAEMLALDGKEFEFGTLNFHPRHVGLLVDRCIKGMRAQQPFQVLVDAGVSPQHAQMSSYVRDSRMATDLGL